MRTQVTMERSFSHGVSRHVVAAVAVVTSVALVSGCSTAPLRVDPEAPVESAAVDAGATGTDEAWLPTGIGAVLRQRAESATQGAVIGALLGAPAGGIVGSGAGAALLGIYGLVTGDVPFGADEPGPRQRGDEPPDAVLAREIDAALGAERNEPDQTDPSDAGTSPPPPGD